MSTKQGPHGPEGPRHDDVTSEGVSAAVTAQLKGDEPGPQGGNQERWLEMILNLMPTPLLFIEPGTGRVFFANAAADRMAGGSMPRAQSAEDFARYYPCSDLDGRPIPSDEMPGVRAARGEEVKATLVRWHLPGGEKIVRIESARLPAAHGHAETVVLAFDDVTAMKEVEARLQEAVRVREDFVSIAGHEMKTPLTALQLTIESLTRLCHPPPTESTLPPTGIAPLPLASQPPPIDPQIVVKADSVQRQVRRLIRLVDQLLDVSRIAAGRFKLAVETFDLVALTAAIIARATEERGPGQSTIELVCDGPVVGTWDRLRVDQVITNLIANAVKYGERTAIQVRVGRTEAGVQVAVSDGGIGIEVAQQERIFDRFERAVSDRNVAGLGLGLWIVRQILEAMNGRIRVESQPGRGATFTVDLPAGRARPT